MRKIVIGIASTVSALVLLFSYHTSTNSTAAKDTTTDTGGGTGTSGGTTPNSAGVSGTFTGDSAATQFGDVQVQITVSGGKITAADAIQYPNGNRHDQQINAYAIPILNSEVVDAQSASIDAVSGATVTSDGYITSLQSAIDAAHLQ